MINEPRIGPFRLVVMIGREASSIGPWLVKRIPDLASPTLS